LVGRAHRLPHESGDTTEILLFRRDLFAVLLLDESRTEEDEGLEAGKGGGLESGYIEGEEGGKEGEEY
jgi:hypothetical protein